MEAPVFSVSQLIAVVNQTLEYAYPTVVVEGEVASFKVSKDKYVFFDLKDDEGVVSCFMMIYQLRVPLEDGMRVRVIAQLRLTAWGKFSLTVREVLPVGQGAIKRAFELLKEKLDKEGLFEPARKRNLPHIPLRVGVIASVESAGYADFTKILQQRWRGLEVEVADVQVQGTNASKQIIRAIDYFNQQADLVEVLVIIRGGGSAEDLAVFNEEPLVRALAGSRIPTLVGVGHEVDTSLCDLAADVRAATPSNAAQLLVPDWQELLRDVMHQRRHVLQQVEAKLTETGARLTAAETTMTAHLEHAVGQIAQHVRSVALVLRQLDPKMVLQRGYSLVRTATASLVKGRAADVRVGDELTVQTSHAIIRAGVTHVTRQ